MTNQTILSVLNYLCNEVRNSVQAGFGLLAMGPALAPEPAREACLHNSKYGADRLLRCIDDMRELLGTETTALEPAEDFDVTLSLGETIDVLNLASRGGASRLILQPTTRPVIGRLHRRASEQVLMRILDAVSKLGRRGEAVVTVVPARGGLRFQIIPSTPGIATRVAEWLNSDTDEVDFPECDEVPHAVATLVAGKRLRALGGDAECVNDVRAPMALVVSLPWQTSAGESCPMACQPDRVPLSILVAEDSDESFALTGIHLQNEVVWRARDGLEAIDMMKTRRFDVVLMDIHMPGLNGYKAIHSMRDWETQTGNARTPIVVLSSDDLDTQMHSAAESGCSGFLRKPLDHHDLMELLDRLKTVRSLSG